MNKKKFKAIYSFSVSGSKALEAYIDSFLKDNVAPLFEVIKSKGETLKVRLKKDKKDI